MVRSCIASAASGLHAPLEAALGKRIHERRDVPEFVEQGPRIRHRAVRPKEDARRLAEPDILVVQPMIEPRDLMPRTPR
jgi:hypothetical protein